MLKLYDITVEQQQEAIQLIYANIYDSKQKLKHLHFEQIM